MIADSIGEIRKGATWPPTPRNRLDSGEIPTEGAGNYGDIPIIRGEKGENSGVGMRSIGGIRVWLLGVRGVFGGSRSWILWVNVQFSCPVERISSRFCPQWESRIPTLSLHTNSSSSSQTRTTSTQKKKKNSNNVFPRVIPIATTIIPVSANARVNDSDGQGFLFLFSFSLRYVHYKS